MDSSAGGSGYEHAYVCPAVRPQHIAALSREERQKIIADYQVWDARPYSFQPCAYSSKQNAVTPADKTGLLSTSPENNVNTAGGSVNGDPKWSTTNGKYVSQRES